MYADFSQNQVRAFLADLTDQPHSVEIGRVAECFSDDMIMAEMELARLKQCKRDGTEFIPREEKLMHFTRIHPADFM